MSVKSMPMAPMASSMIGASRTTLITPLAEKGGKVGRLDLARLAAADEQEKAALRADPGQAVAVAAGLVGKVEDVALDQVGHLALVGVGRRGGDDHFP